MSTSIGFDPTDIVALADSDDLLGGVHLNREMKDALAAQVETTIGLVNKSVKKYHWIGGFHFSDEFMPFMTSILEALDNYREQIASETEEKPLTYEALLVMVSVLYDIRSSVVEKTKAMEAYIARTKEYRNLPFEPVDCELYRRIGEIIQLSKLCSFFDEHLEVRNLAAIKRRRDKNLISYIMIGRRRRFGDLTKQDILCLMPAIADEHINMYLQFKAKLERIGHEVTQHEFEQLVNVNVKKDAAKMLKEIPEMTRYLMENGYSRNWRQFFDDKVEEALPIIQQHGNGQETKEAIQFLNFHYYRIRLAYEKKKGFLDTPFVFKPREDGQVVVNQNRRLP